MFKETLIIVFVIVAVGFIVYVVSCHSAFLP
jgi:hypothetical protein